MCQQKMSDANARPSLESLQRSTVRDIDVSRHHGDPIKDPLKPLEHPR